MAIRTNIANIPRFIKPFNIPSVDMMPYEKIGRIANIARSGSRGVHKS